MYHSVLVASSEFGNLVSEYSLEFLNALNELYDCGPVFEERTRGGKETLHIEKPHITILSGTQPSYLGHVFPETAYGMGFASRLLMVYAPAGPKLSLFAKRQKTPGLNRELIKHMQRLIKMRGRFEWDERAAIEIDAWHQADCPPAPDHHKLLHYTTRRIAHVIKLCQIFSAAESDSLIIMPSHFHAARDLLLEAEHWMPEIFKEMAGKGAADVINEAWRFLWQRYSARKKPIPESQLIYFLSDKIPAREVMYFIKVMYDSQMIRDENPGLAKFPGQGRMIVPVEKFRHGMEN